MCENSGEDVRAVLTSGDANDLKLMNDIFGHKAEDTMVERFIAFLDKKP